MIHRRRILQALVVTPFWVAHSTQSHASDIYDDYVNSVSKQPFVAFLGREANLSTVGHAFVGIGVQLDTTLLVYERLFGLYPKDGTLAAVKSVFSSVSGKLDLSWSDIAWDTEIRRFIDDNQKAKVLSQFLKWSSDEPEYSLLSNSGINCNGLVGDVASSLDMKVPKGAGTTRPWKFIEALKLENCPQQCN